MLQVIDLQCERGEQILFSQLGFELAAGEALHVCGPNGSGKSSLLAILCGLLNPSQGSWRWQAQTVNSDSSYWQQLHFLGHKIGIKSLLTVAENLQFAALLAQATTDIEAIAEQAGLEKILQRRADRLSFGQQRRLALCRLLISQKPLWILDEPFTGLDQLTLDWLQQLLQQHVLAGGMVIFTSHKPPVLDKIKVNTVLI